MKQANTTDAAPVAVAGANGSAPVAVANSSEARMVARRKRSPLTPEEQAAKEAEFKLKPCFDFAESQCLYINRTRHTSAHGGCGNAKTAPL